MPTKIIIDTDPGIDDAMAIHLAFAHPSIDVVGLTSVFGNVHVPIATRNALALAEMAGVDCPVCEGADTPLVQALNPPAYFVHGDTGFGTFVPQTPAQKPLDVSAAQFIVDTVNADPGSIALCPVGPLTNIALALRLDPSIRTKVANVVIMGGALDRAGNIPPAHVAEANIWNDPHAAAEVFATDWPMTMIGLDVTELSRCTPEDFSALAVKAPVIGGFLDAAVQFYFEWHRKKAVLDGCFLHDPSAVLATVEPDLFNYVETPLSVSIDGAEIGRTQRADTGPIVRVATAVDTSKLVERFLQTLGTADICRAARMG